MSKQPADGIAKKKKKKRADSPKGQRWGGKVVRAGERAAVHLHVSESFLGLSVPVPLHVWRGKKPGPTLLISAAVHGDEINGTGVIRQLIVQPDFELLRGTLVLAPVINVLGFERHERYLPDRRDLNRCFPGSKSGSVAARLARVVYDKLIKKCDYAIDLHTAAVRRTNFPNVRGDMSDPGVKRLARAFGCELILDSEGPAGSMRQVATAAGCPTMILEAGEVWKVEPSVVAYSLRGIRNVLVDLEMIEGEVERSPYQAIVKTTTWVRAPSGGILEFHIAPGDLVEKGQPVATLGDLLCTQSSVIEAPQAGVVVGMTTIPSVAPGDPVVHIAVPEDKQIRRIERGIDRLDEASLGTLVRNDLASSVRMSDVPVEGAGDDDM